MASKAWLRSLLCGMYLLTLLNFSNCFIQITVEYKAKLSKHTPHIIIRYTVTVYPKKYAHGFCFAVLCCGYTLTDSPISIRLTSLALWQSNDCPSASKATLMNMDKYFMWIHYERLHNHNKAMHNKTVCIFLGIYCTYPCHNRCYSIPFKGTAIYLILDQRNTTKTNVKNPYRGIWSPQVNSLYN